jgi:hypothetical protein
MERTHCRTAQADQMLLIKRPIRSLPDFLTQRSHAMQYIAPDGIRGMAMDLLFLLLVVVLYMSTHWLLAAVSRLGASE